MSFSQKFIVDPVEWSEENLGGWAVLPIFVTVVAIFACLLLAIIEIVIYLTSLVAYFWWTVLIITTISFVGFYIYIVFKSKDYEKSRYR